MMAFRSTVWAFCLVLLGTACASPRGAPDALPSLDPGREPPPQTTEAGLWMEMDYLEKRLRTSRRLLDHAPVERYVRSVVCRLAGPYCPHIRVYIVQTPGFNASMAPNGMMQVWTGLLLRAENEAQLAYVLGHELAHYLRRHSLQQWRDIRLKSTLLTSFNLATGAIGYGSLGNLAQIFALGSIFAFSRDNEREADSLGFELMVEAGYAPQEAPKIWQALLEELQAADTDEPLIFFSTHPTTEERIETLQAFAEQATAAHPNRTWTVGRASYHHGVASVRFRLLEDEIGQRTYARTEVLLNRLIDHGDEDQGMLHYVQGELYRLRSDKGDAEKALKAYQKALEDPEPPVQTYRSMGLIYSKLNRGREAIDFYRRYLEVASDPADEEMIRAYLDRLGSTAR